MRKSHTQKVADRRKKRQRRWLLSRRRIRESLYLSLPQNESPLARLLRDIPSRTLEPGEWSYTALGPSVKHVESIGLPLDEARRMDDLLDARHDLVIMDDIEDNMPEKARTIVDRFLEEKSRAYAKDAAEKAFIAPIINTNPSAEPAEKGE